MSLETVKSALKQKMSYANAINAKIKLDFGDDGQIMIDATQTPANIDENDGDADLTVSCSKDVFEGIVAGTQDPNIAFMMGKLKVKGNMGLAMKLNSLLED